MNVRRSAWVWGLVGLAGLLLVTGGAFAAEQKEDPKAKDPNFAVLKLTLPAPSSSGTPLDYWSEHLEIMYKPRPPFYVPKDAVLLSANKPVTTSDKECPAEKVKMVTDGDKKYEEGSVLVLKPGVQWVQIDLEQKCRVDAVVVWHFHEYERVYFDVVVRVSNDPEFKDDVTTLFNNDFDQSAKIDLDSDVKKDKEYVEKAEGRLIDGKGKAGRYVRLYSHGNTTDDTNTYIEVEVYGARVQE